MKSGLVGRNNPGFNVLGCIGMHVVSMKSGLEDRNNGTAFTGSTRPSSCLDEVRPGRPEQFPPRAAGIGGRGERLNEVRPGRPEQWTPMAILSSRVRCLNEVRPGRPEQSTVRLPPRRGKKCLNEVRPGRPEQWRCITYVPGEVDVSMKSGLEDRNNIRAAPPRPSVRGRLNEVRPGRPEQFSPRPTTRPRKPTCLNELRPGRPEQ